MRQVSDTAAIEAVIDQVIAENADAVERYRACDCEADALAFVRETGAPIVVKALMTSSPAV